MKQEMFSKQDAPEEPAPKKPYSQQKLATMHKTGAQTQPKDSQASKAMVMPQNGKKKGLPRHFGAKNRWIEVFIITFKNRWI